MKRANTMNTDYLWIKLSGAALLALLSLPLVILIGVSLNSGATQMFPPDGLSLRWYFDLVNRDGLIDAVQLTLILAAGSALVNIVIAVLAGLAIVRNDFFGKDFLLTLLLSPLIVPQVVIGIGFLITLSALGIFSSLIALALLHVVITLPYAMQLIVATLKGASTRLEEAARSLGASPARAFCSVTLPLIRSGVIAGLVFVFVTSFENFTASQFLVWDRTTLPVKIYGYVQTESSPVAAAMSSLVVLTVIVLVVMFNRFVRRMFSAEMSG